MHQTHTQTHTLTDTFSPITTLHTCKFSFSGSIEFLSCKSCSSGAIQNVTNVHARAHARTHRSSPSNKTNICILGLSSTLVYKCTELAFCRAAQLMFPRLWLPQGQVSHSLHPHPPRHRRHPLPFSTATSQPPH